MCDRLVDELSIWLNERVKGKEEKNMFCTLWPYETHTRKSLTLVVTDGCWPPLLLLTNIHRWTNARARIMYKLIERARKKSVRAHAIASRPVDLGQTEREREKKK
jgi:hypothetical protein